ncbi:hypothetical protein HDA36_001451 [Nocardiopsis composta]|uniref:Uncharacterized protein n=1 Tax=Nocardiopsis composta TaxID=157465 RepID=A0A7W8VCM6_9ACTN|nr:hypothetical protein [Nocardiopsis composta]
MLVSLIQSFPLGLRPGHGLQQLPKALLFIHAGSVERRGCPLQVNFPEKVGMSAASSSARPELTERGTANTTGLANEMGTR